MVETLRNLIAEQIQNCNDTSLLDLVYKLLLAETS